jgi:hypothetical protein
MSTIIGVPMPQPEAPVLGTSDARTGVTGLSNRGNGVLGVCETLGGPPVSDGVLGRGKNGVHGQSASPTDSGVWGENTGGGTGVAGNGKGGFGWLGCSDPQFHQHAGVYGQSDQQGVMGLTTVPKGTGVYGGGTTGAQGDQIGVRGETATNVGVQGQSFGSGLAGRFIGDVEVTGDVRLVAGNDCGEHFRVSGTEPEPGTVMCICEDGTLSASQRSYDRKVAGVVSGAGSFKPGIVLGAQSENTKSSIIALIGRVYCQVDAGDSPIEIGDLLTTADVPGHAMKAQDPLKAFGAIIGKALGALPSGRGLIPVLVALQ